jgi:hypothetical protein
MATEASVKAWAISRGGKLIAGAIGATRDAAWIAAKPSFVPYIGHPKWCRCPKCLRILGALGYRAVRVAVTARVTP